MSGPYLGIPGNVAFPSAGTITNATNANPIAITVSGTLPSQIANGAQVTITGVGGNTAANGEWPVTVTGASTFTIPVAGNGAYTSGGSVSFPFPASFQIPSDGDARSAASVNVPFCSLGDRTLAAFLASGAYKLAQHFDAQHSDDTMGSWVDGSPGSTGGWLAGSVVWPFTGLLSGDILICTLRGNAGHNLPGTGPRVSLMSAIAVPGGTYGAYAKISGSAAPVFDYGTFTCTNTFIIVPMMISGIVHIGGTGETDVKIAPGFWITSGTSGGGAIGWNGDYTFTADVLRPTGVPQ